jgi:lipoprotein NlpI
MESVTYERVINLAEQLTPQEQEALVAHLQQLAQQRQLTKQERTALFESMIVDLGPVSPDFSFRREDWYGDDER